MKRLTRVIGIIAFCTSLAQWAAADYVRVGCSLDRDEEIAVYTGTIVLEPPWNYRIPLVGYYVNWWEQIFGTDAGGPEWQQEYLYWPSAEIDDPAVYQLNPLGGCDTPWIHAEAFGLEDTALGDELCWDPYQQPQCILSISASGGGSLSPNPSGSYDCGTTFTLTAVPAPDYYFLGWEGDISSYSSTINFVLSHDMTLIAHFEALPPPPPPADDCSADWTSGCSPIVINFAHGEYELTGAESYVSFDIAATGRPVRIGWTAAGANEAFLCMDRNDNGLIDNGAELFGTATPLKNGRAAGNGFVALMEFDDNRDGVLDEHDQIWRQLLLWRDLNHDAISQPSEITPIAGSGLTAIHIDYHWTGRRDVFGNLFKYESTISIVNKAGHSAPQPVYDVFFVRVP